MSLLRIQKLRDVGRSDFHFERGGHAIEGFHALTFEFLAVLVQVNKAGSDYEACGMDDSASTERSGGDADDLSIADAHVADGVEGGLGVDHAPAFDNNVVLLRSRERGDEKAESQEQFTHGLR